MCFKTPKWLILLQFCTDRRLNWKFIYAASHSSAENKFLKCFLSPVTWAYREKRTATILHLCSPGSTLASRTRPGSVGLPGRSSRLVQPSAQGCCSWRSHAVEVTTAEGQAIARGPPGRGQDNTATQPAALNLDPPSVPPTRAQRSHKATQGQGEALGYPSISSNEKHSQRASCSADAEVFSDPVLGAQHYPFLQPKHALVAKTRSTAWRWTANCSEICLSGGN